MCEKYFMLEGVEGVEGEKEYIVFIINSKK